MKFFEKPLKSEKRNEAAWKPGVGTNVIIRRKGQIEEGWAVMAYDELTGDTIVVKPDPENEGENLSKTLSVSELEKLNNPDKMDLRDAGSFEELYALIRQLGPMSSGKGLYEEPEDLIDRINTFKEKGGQLNSFTENYGLRQSIDKLMQQESQQ